MLDSQAGTHLVPPAYALPARASTTRPMHPRCGAGWRSTRRSTARAATSDVTTEKVPVSQTCGPARIIDVKQLRGTTDRDELAGLAGDHRGRHSKDEGHHGELRPGRHRHLPQRLERPILPAASGRQSVSGRTAQRQTRRLAGARAGRGRLPGKKGSALRGDRRANAGRRRAETSA